MRQLFVLAHDEARRRALEAIRSAPEGKVVEIKDKTRSLDQNAALWGLLNEIAEQVVWHGRKLTPENWKDILSASLKRQEAVPGIDGGFVILGARTSRMTKREFSDLLDLAQAFAAQQGVETACNQ